MKTKNHLIQKMLHAGAVTILCLAISSSLFSQERLHNITGKIVAAKNGEPLNGASVMVASTTKGTVSNEKGIFSITAVSLEDSLIISFTGYATQHVAIAGQTNITITLTEGETSLEDVVVVGYGRQAKQNVVGAVSVTKGEDIVKSNASSLSNSLAGRVSGVIAVQRSAEPGDDDAELFIRGMATLNDNSPLIMVDGIQRDFSQIDPNEIATISILKDASATAIYGTRGANGVILVTTKRGVTSKPVFNYTGYVGWQNVINVPDYVNSYDFARLYNQAALNDNPDLQPDELPYSDEDIQKYKDHSAPYTHPDIKWYESIIEPNALQTRHSVSMTGGSDKFRYFMLLGYLDQQGIYRSDNLTRYNGRINIDADVTKTTTISATVAGDFGHRSRPGTGNAKDDGGIFSLVVYLPPNAFPVKNEDGTWASLWGANPVADVTISGSRDNYPTNMQTAVNVNQRLDGGNIGRATKGACLALKSRLLLFAASPLHNPGNDASEWQKAADAAKAVIDLGVYSLYPDYYGLFHVDNNEEVIFDIQYAYPTRTQNAEYWLNPQGLQGAFGAMRPTTQEMVDYYEMSNGRAITDAGSGYDAQNPYQDRDPRFYASVLYNEAPWRGGVVETFFDGANGPGEFDQYATSVAMTGYYIRKFINENNPVAGVDKANENWILVRYAEVLLNYAEAQVALGNDAEARAYINMVRKRSGMPDLPASLSGNALLQRCRNERSVELCFEELHFFDVRRWKTAPDILSRPVHKMDIKKLSANQFSYTVKEMEERVWRDAFYYLPIPQDEINKNPNLLQNDGY